MPLDPTAHLRSALVDFTQIVRAAWRAYDDSREIAMVTDISAMVSTNHVYRIRFTDRSFVVAKLSYFGRFEHFAEDHAIINSLCNNLPAPFENFLARSLVKGERLFVYRHTDSTIDAWVVFYRPVRVRERLPARLDEDQIDQLAHEFAHFHRACFQVRNTLPQSSKTVYTDIAQLLAMLETPEGKFEYRGYDDFIREQCDAFRQNTERYNADNIARIPVFVDWNIGNFSLTPTGRFYSRWDYDWFRMSGRIMDFYFAARVVSDVGDRTTFTYNVDILNEPRFVRFLQRYHAEYPLSRNEIMLIGEVYRFFLLNYVIKDGRYFFHEIFATKLMAEALSVGLESVQRFDGEALCEAVGV